MFLSSLFAALVCAGVAPISGNDPFVVYAELVDAQQVEGGQYIVQLKPFATLQGNFDPALEGEITAYVVVGPLVSKIEELPAKGAKVIALVGRRDLREPRHRNDNVKFSIGNGSVPFFPAKNKFDNYPAVFEVTDFDDPRVTETIENLHKLRGKQREEAEKAQAEKK